MDKWKEILNKRELPSIDENKKRQSIEILKMESVRKSSWLGCSSNFLHEGKVRMFTGKMDVW